MSLIQRRAKKKKYGKYNAVKTMLDGVLYDSKLEAKYAGILKMRIRAGEIVGFERQIWISICIDQNGKAVAHYVMDFVVHYPDASTEWVEVKGFKTAVWKLKWKMLKTMYPNQRMIVVTADDI